MVERATKRQAVRSGSRRRIAGSQRRRSVGSDVVARLQRFTERLESLPATSDLGDHFTCRTVRLQLQSRSYTPSLVRQTRRVLQASQAIFAQFLGVSLSTVQDWEQGQKPPHGSACRLMDEIRRDSGYWQKRLRELAEPVNPSAGATD
jgi:putative transcriptional regulator